MTEEFSDSPVVRAVPDFRAFYQREYRPVLGMAYALSGDMTVAEDLCQDAFMAAFRRWSEVGAMDHPGAWVRRVVANRSASRFRRLAAEGRAMLRLGRPSHEIPSPSADSLAVWAVLRRLPPRQAEIVVLTYFADLSNAEAAAVMGCSVETARTHLKRAKARLADALGEDE
ncbi:MAG: SigE family RNA polymerase sigma factor [Actinobacteria bacterium]|nr:SigE family RNA polymerase sigma factor [Actinomycetota bacterium]